MQHVIMAIHLMTVVALVTLILYQKSEGGALGLGQSGFFSGRGQANALTRATSILATIFFVTSVLLTVIPSWERRSLGGEDWTKAVEPEKVQLKEIKPEAAPQAQKEIPIPKEKESVFEQLKRAQEQRQQGAGAPALRQAPEVPAASPPQSEPPAAPAPEAETAPVAPEPAAPKSEAPAAAAPKTEAAPAAPEPSAPKSEAKPEEVKPAPEAAPAPSAPPPAVQWKSPTSEPAAPKSETPAAAAPKTESAPAAPEPKSEAPAAAAPKTEAAPAAPEPAAPKPEEAKPAPEAAPAPSAAPPAVQWKSPTK